MLILKLDGHEALGRALAEQRLRLNKLVLLKGVAKNLKEKFGATSVVVKRERNGAHEILGLVFNGVGVDESLWIEVEDKVWMPRPDSRNRRALQEMLECDVPPHSIYGLGVIDGIHAPTLITTQPHCYAVYKDLEPEDFEREEFDEAREEGWSLVQEYFIEELWGN